MMLRRYFAFSSPHPGVGRPSRWQSGIRAFAVALSLIGYHAQAIAANTRLGVCHLRLGKYTVAIPLLEKQVEKLKVKRGIEHPDTLETMAILADGYRLSSQLTDSRVGRGPHQDCNDSDR